MITLDEFEHAIKVWKEFLDENGGYDKVNNNVKAVFDKHLQKSLRKPTPKQIAIAKIKKELIAINDMFGREEVDWDSFGFEELLLISDRMEMVTSV